LISESRVLENRVVRRTFGPKKDETMQSWMIVPNEELRNLYSSPNIARIIKSRRMMWLGHVARIGRGEMPAGIW
jgi:hypothetical protein